MFKELFLDFLKALSLPAICLKKLSSHPWLTGSFIPLLFFYYFFFASEHESYTFLTDALKPL